MDKLKEPSKEQKPKPKPKLGLLLWIEAILLLLVLIRPPFEIMIFADPDSHQVKVLEELSSEEKREMTRTFLEEGDRYFQEKDYDQANAAYERIFVLDPNNLEASKRIDRLKKQMLAEGRSETSLVAHVYDAEIEARSHYYLKKAKELAGEKKWGQARFTLEKLLLINPLHEEAQKLYKDLKSKQGLEG